MGGPIELERKKFWTCGQKKLKHNTYLFNLVGDKGKKLEYTFIRFM